MILNLHEVNMNICFVSHGTFPHVQPYVDYFKSCGHNVYFLALTPSHDRGVKTYQLGFGNYEGDSGKWKYFVSAFRARRLLKRLKPDIVHSHYATSAGITSLIVNHPAAVVTVHGSDLTCGMKSRFWRPLLKMIFNQAACVNVVSDDLRRMAMELGVPDEKIAVINVGIDAERFSFKERSLISKSRPLRLVNTRRLEPVYDHPTIIDALEILNNKGVDFCMTFVGNGELHGQLQQLVDVKGLNGKVSFVGGVPNEQMPQFLHNNDIYLSASLWDGTSLCLLEAMATGILPIVSDIPANSDWIKDGVNGFLHKVGASDEIAASIRKVLNAPQIITGFAQKNRDIVLERGSRAANMGRIEDVYKKILLK